MENDKLVRLSDVLKLFEDEERYGYIDEQDVRSIPAVDAVEVRHGKWVFDGEDWFCTRCGHSALCEKDTGEQVLSIICPNCCVRMDG